MTTQEMKDGLPVHEIQGSPDASPFEYQADVLPHITARMGELEFEAAKLRAQLMAQGQKFLEEVQKRDARIAELEGVKEAESVVMNKKAG